MKNKDFKEELTNTLNSWFMKQFIAGYKSCCESIINMIDENVPIEKIRDWCGTSHKNADTINEVMYKKDGDSIDKD